MAFLKVENLSVNDRRNGRALVDRVSLELTPGGCLGLVGESGSGKSLTCRAILGLIKAPLNSTGRVLLNGQDILEAGEDKMNRIRGRRIGLIIQEAMSAFNPLFRIGPQMTETLSQHRKAERKQAVDICRAALGRLGLADPAGVMAKYPHQLSGGMLQRVMIALTLTLEPEVIIADEPTTALDSVTRNEIVRELADLKTRLPGGLIFVSHDLAVVRRLADQVAVLKEGRVVESGPMKDIFSRPGQPYTRRLVQAHQDLSRRFTEVMRPREAA